MYDVIVVGAGPAGSMLAYNLASLGIRTLILEKGTLPRYKACGGGINIRATKLIPFDISEIVEEVIYGTEISCHLGSRFQRSYPDPLAYMTMRDRLDYLLARKAQEAGSELVEGAKVTCLFLDNKKVSLITTKGTFESLYVAGCDGANSVIARQIGLENRTWTDIALEIEYKPTNAKLLRYWSKRVGIDVGSIPGGYAWIFPKRDHLSIGAGCPIRHIKQLRPYIKDFVKYHGLVLNDDIKVSGHFMPIRRPGTLVQKGRALLVGDAAGFVDPFTGDGIYPAIKSAAIAAQALKNTIEHDSWEMTLYQILIDRDLTPELESAAFATKLFALNSCAITNLMKKYDRIWRFMCKLLRGERTYVSLTKHLFVFQALQRVSKYWNPLGW